MSDRRARLPDQTQIFSGDKIGMGKYGALPQQAEALKDLGIGFAKARLYELSFPITFRTMRLDETAGLRSKLAQALEQRIGATGNKSWRNDRLDQRIRAASQLPHALDERSHFANRGRRIAVTIDF